MFGSIGFPELMIILIIALLVFGPKKLPEVGRSIGRAMREFRKTTDEIKGRIEDEIQADEFRDVKKEFDDVRNTRFDIGSDKNKEPNQQKEKPQPDPYNQPGDQDQEPVPHKNNEVEKKSSSKSTDDKKSGKSEHHGEGKKNS